MHKSESDASPLISPAKRMLRMGTPGCLGHRLATNSPDADAGSHAQTSRTAGPLDRR